MGISKKPVKAGTRPSSLALTQSRNALDRIERLLENVLFESVPISSVGDRDRTTDLRKSPPNFFTRELDEALLRGEIDLAVHSAKDLPDPMPEGIDWFWLPWREEPRDVLVLAKGRSVSDLPEDPVIGVSSDRREEYSSSRFPKGIQKPIRGNIEERIAKVDDGTFDIVIMAAAALVRLGMEDRVTEWIELNELEVPEGQGYLAVTFREGDSRISALRNLLIKADSTATLTQAEDGALRGRKVLLTCSDAIQEEASGLVSDYGGQPVSFPLIRLQTREQVTLRCEQFDWLIITSPSSARSFMTIIDRQGTDLGTLPRIMVCGRGTAGEFLKYGLDVDAQPQSDFSAESLVRLSKEILKPDEKILRLRSDKAGPKLTESLRENDLTVEDVIIYDNERVQHDELPEFDAVFFASASAVDSFAVQWGISALSEKIIAVIGRPTAFALDKYNIRPDVIAREATVEGTIKALAGHCVGEELCSRK